MRYSSIDVPQPVSRHTSEGPSSWRSAATTLVAISIFAIYAARIYHGELLWDFRTHYHAALAWSKGLNPYVTLDLNRVNLTGILIPWQHQYAYHPYTLLYFRLFTLLPYSIAAIVYGTFQALLAGALITWWWTSHVSKKSFFRYLLIIVAGFNATFVIAMESGNTALVETSLIWVGLSALLAGKRFTFCLVLFVLSFFKVVPILLLPLVFILPQHRKNIMATGLTLLLLVLTWSSAHWTMTTLFADYFSVISQVNERGAINPCMLALLGELFPNDPIALLTTYSVWLEIVLVGCLICFQRSKKHQIAILLLAYALCVPRFKDYAYLQLLPLAYQVSLTSPILLFINLSALISPAFHHSYFLSQYHPLLVAIIDWLVLISPLGERAIPALTLDQQLQK